MSSRAGRRAGITAARTAGRGGEPDGEGLRAVRTRSVALDERAGHGVATAVQKLEVEAHGPYRPGGGRDAEKLVRVFAPLVGVRARDDTPAPVVDPLGEGLVVLRSDRDAPDDPDGA